MKDRTKMDKDTKDLVDYIIDASEKLGKGLSQLSLQRVLYTLQYEWLERTGKPITDLRFEAWKFGPCCPAVYYDHIGQTTIWNMNSKKADVSGRFTKDELETIDCVVSKILDDPYAADPTLFGKGSLYYRIRKEYEELKPDAPRTAGMFYEPPIFAEDILGDIRNGKEYNENNGGTHAYEKDLKIPSSVKYFVAPLLETKKIDCDAYGIEPFRPLFSWDVRLNSCDHVQVDVGVYNEDEGMRVRVHLFQADRIAQTITSKNLTGTHELYNEHNGVSCRLTIK